MVWAGFSSQYKTIGKEEAHIIIHIQKITHLETLKESTKKTQVLIRYFNKMNKYISSVQFSSLAQSCPTLCDPMNHSTPDLPVLHQLPEFAQTNIHRVGDAIQPSHPLLSPSPPAPNPSQHQSLFQ